MPGIPRTLARAPTPSSRRQEPLNGLDFGDDDEDVDCAARSLSVIFLYCTGWIMCFFGVAYPVFTENPLVDGREVPSFEGKLTGVALALKRLKGASCGSGSAVLHAVLVPPPTVAAHRRRPPSPPIAVHRRCAPR